MDEVPGMASKAPDKVTWLYAAANFERNSSIDRLAIIEVARLSLREVEGKDFSKSAVVTAHGLGYI
jgi:hypothetical protein